MKMTPLLLLTLAGALVYLAPWPARASKLSTLGLYTFAIALFWFAHGVAGHRW